MKVLIDNINYMYQDVASCDSKGIDWKVAETDIDYIIVYGYNKLEGNKLYEKEITDIQQVKKDILKEFKDEILGQTTIGDVKYNIECKLNAKDKKSYDNITITWNNS